MKING
jgi:predicted aspartyl protease